MRQRDLAHLAVGLLPVRLLRLPVGLGLLAVGVLLGLLPVRLLRGLLAVRLLRRLLAVGVLRGLLAVRIRHLRRHLHKTGRADAGNPRGWTGPWGAGTPSP
ncbi:hypothetical protein GCM10009593_34590 [Microlunatus antarcticus]